MSQMVTIRPVTAIQYQAAFYVSLLKFSQGQAGSSGLKRPG
jgi:hypothetical protein